MKKKEVQVQGKKEDEQRKEKKFLGMKEGMVATATEKREMRKNAERNIGNMNKRCPTSLCLE